MSEENNNTKFKILIGILTVLLIALGIYTVKLFNQNRETISTLEEDKVEIVEDLESLIVNYDKVIQDNELKDENIIAAKERIEILLDSVKNAKANVDLIRRYKIEIGKLKTERILMFKRADSLIASNQKLLVERDSTVSVLNETIKVVDSVSDMNETLAETVKRGAAVKVSDVSGTGVVVKNSGKIVDTKRARRANNIRTCFTLTENVLAEKGDRLFLVQVINPKNNVIGKKATMNFEDGKSLLYSATSKVYYENEELDVCVLVSATENDLVAGNYTVNIFDGANLVASTTLTLK